jgi:5-formyltetrahydrofolate cyclo-ligase
MDEKARLRRSVSALISGLDERCAREAGEAVAVRLAQSSDWLAADAIALFSTLPGEVDTTPLIDAARRAGKRVLLPRMVPGRTLEFARVSGLESLRAGRYGVLEPEARIAAESTLEGALVLVPGCAFDRDGGRLGRGEGYYDRALAPLRAASVHATFIGVAFTIQIVEAVPMTPFDVRMDGVVTETAFFRNG